MRSSLSKYTFCVKCALSYTASKFQAFAVVSVAYLQAVSLTHTWSVTKLDIPAASYVSVIAIKPEQLSFLHGRRVFIWHKALPLVCSNPGRQVAMASKFCLVAPDICGSSVWNLLCVTLVAHRILRWLIDFWKVFASLLYNNERYVLLEAHSKTVD